MLSIRNRHFGSDVNQILPWGDPYILQLFESLLPDQESRDEPSGNTSYRAEHYRICREPVPSRVDPRSDFDRHGRHNLT